MADNTEALRSGPMGALLFRLYLPAALGMAVQASYSLVDAFFVGQGVGPAGITAVSMTFPLQMIIMAVAQAGGVGGASVISRSLGAGRRKRAEKTAGTVFFATWAAGLLLSVLWILLAPFLLRLIGTSGDILPLAEEYAAVLFLGAPFFAFSITANNFVRAEGNASFAMMTMIISAGINTLLDPLFILGFGWGVRGAAWATVISQGATALGLGWYYLAGRSLVAFRWKHFRFRASILAECISVGAAAFARQGAASLSLLAVNLALVSTGGDDAVAAYGIVNRVLLFAVMPVFGIVQGLLPVVGFNYGAKQHCRVVSALRISIGASTVLCAAGAVLFLTVPEEITGLFTSSPRSRPSAPTQPGCSPSNAPHGLPDHGVGSFPGHRQGPPLLRPLPAPPGHFSHPPGDGPRTRLRHGGGVGFLSRGGPLRRPGDMASVPERNAPPPAKLRKRR